MKKAAIYHCTDSSGARPIIFESQIFIMEKFAVSQGFTVEETFLDKSLRRCDHAEFNRFLSLAENFDFLITKDFYHICKNTSQCIRIMKDLWDRGVKVVTPVDGAYECENVPFENTLKVATYCSRYSDKKEEYLKVKEDTLALFVEKKTNWSLIGRYHVKSIHQNNGEQPQLTYLLNNRDQYDILLVHSLNDIKWRTPGFCKIRRMFRLDIYSLQDGFLKYSEVKV